MKRATGAAAGSTAAFDPEDDLPPEDPRLAQMRRLVTILLVVLIVGVSTVVIALLLKLKDFAVAPVSAAAGQAAEHAIAGIRPGERLVAAEADIDRITLLLEDNSGVRRAVVLDGQSFQPLGAVSDRISDEGSKKALSAE